MMRNFWMCTSVLVGLTVSTARGDEASKKIKVAEFIRVSRMENTLQQVLTMSLNQVKSGVLQQLMGIKLPPEVEQSVGEFQDKIGKIIVDALAWEKLEPDYIKLFSEAYSESELDDLLVFYKSPTGQAMLSKTPGLMAKSSELVQQRIATVAPELQKLMADFIAQVVQKVGPPTKKE